MNLLLTSDNQELYDLLITHGHKVSIVSELNTLLTKVRLLRADAIIFDCTKNTDCQGCAERLHAARSSGIEIPIIIWGSPISGKQCSGCYMVSKSGDPKRVLLDIIQDLASRKRMRARLSWLPAALAILVAFGLYFVNKPPHDLSKRIAAYRDLMEHVESSLIITDHNGKIIEWSHQASNLTGWTADQIIGDSLSVLGLDDLIGKGGDSLAYATQHNVLTKHGSTIKVASYVRCIKNGEKYYLIILDRLSPLPPNPVPPRPDDPRPPRPYDPTPNPQPQPNQDDELY